MFKRFARVLPQDSYDKHLVRDRGFGRVRSFKDFQDLFFTGCIRCFGEVFGEWVHCLSAAVALTRGSDLQTVARLESRPLFVCLLVKSESVLSEMPPCNSPAETLHFGLKGVLPDSLGFSLFGSLCGSPLMWTASALPQFRRCSMCFAAELLLAVGGHPTRFSARGLCPFRSVLF